MSLETIQVCIVVLRFAQKMSVFTHWIARIGSAGQRRDSPWRLRGGASARGTGPCQRSGPSCDVGKIFVDSTSGRYYTLCQHPERHNFGFTALRGTDLLISCKEARWSQCSAPCVWFPRWSRGATISAQGTALLRLFATWSLSSRL